MILKPVILKSYVSRIEERLKNFYDTHLTDKPYKQYKYDISLTYLLDKASSRIIKAKMNLTEELHDYLSYKISFSLNQIN